MKHLTSIFIAVICIATCGFGEPNIGAIKEYIENSRVAWNIPGMAVAIVKDGEILSESGYGYLKEGEQQKADEHSLFAIASNTKAFVSSAIGVLQEENKLQLDHKVRQYIPGFQLYDPYVSSETTIADLLCHRVGLGTFSGDVIWYKSDFTAEEVIEKIQYVPRTFSFRAGYVYSNLMFITAGEVIRKASGEPWDEFVKRRFFEPLSMERTITSITHLEEKGNYAIPHKPVGEINLPIEWVNWDNMGAAGGIISSSHDMAQWLIFQLNHGIWENDTILNPTIQNILWTPHNNYLVSLTSKMENPGTNFAGYGLGWSVRDYYGNRLITHGGGYDGMYSQVAMIPELKLGIVILTNSMKGIANPLRNYIINEFIQKEEKDWLAEALEASKKKSRVDKIIEAQKEARILTSNPTCALVDYTGTYATDMLGEIYITEKGGQLRLEFEHAPNLSATLAHWHYDSWEIKWDNVHAWFDFGTIQFHYDNQMDIIGFEFDVPNDDIFFHELHVEKIN